VVARHDMALAQRGNAGIFAPQSYIDDEKKFDC
jgi:hypothetical protein